MQSLRHFLIQDSFSGLHNWDMGLLWKPQHLPLCVDSICSDMSLIHKTLVSPNVGPCLNPKVPWAIPGLVQATYIHRYHKAQGTHKRIGFGIQISLNPKRLIGFFKNGPQTGQAYMQVLSRENSPSPSSDCSHFFQPEPKV